MAFNNKCLGNGLVGTACGYLFIFYNHWPRTTLFEQNMLFYFRKVKCLIYADRAGLHNLVVFRLQVLTVQVLNQQTRIIVGYPFPTSACRLFISQGFFVTVKECKENRLRLTSFYSLYLLLIIYYYKITLLYRRAYMCVWVQSWAKISNLRCKLEVCHLSWKRFVKGWRFLVSSFGYKFVYSS